MAFNAAFFMLKLLKKIAVMGVEKEFHLTKNAGLQCRELNRYIDMLPCALNGHF